MEKAPLHLQTVIVRKSPGMTVADARTIAQGIIQDRRKRFVREKEETFHFRNIAKTEFQPGSFVSKKVNDTITLVFGRLQ